MDFPVNRDDVARLDKLYHTLLQQDLNSELKHPKELKNLTNIDISVVNTVATNPSIMIRELAEHLKIPNSTLTSSINRLEKKGLAKRVIGVHDRRSFSLELTEKGWDMQQKHLDFETTYLESILTRLRTHEERKAFLDLIEIIVNSNKVNENHYSDLDSL